MHLKQTQVPYVWSRHSSHVSQEQTRDSHKSRADSVPKSRKPTQFPQVWSRNIYQNSSALKYVPYVCGDTCPKSRLQICTRTYCIPLVRWSGPDTILYQYLSQMSGIDPSTVSERQRCHICSSGTDPSTIPYLFGCPPLSGVKSRQLQLGFSSQRSLLLAA